MKQERNKTKKERKKKQTNIRKIFTNVNQQKQRKESTT